MPACKPLLWPLVSVIERMVPFASEWIRHPAVNRTASGDASFLRPCGVSRSTIVRNRELRRGGAQQRKRDGGTQKSDLQNLGHICLSEAKGGIDVALPPSSNRTRHGLDNGAPQYEEACERSPLREQ